MKIYFKNKIIMNNTLNIKKIISGITLITILWSNLAFVGMANASNIWENKFQFPLKTVSKLECRFTHFDKLSANCKQQMPILETKDYKKYVKKNWGHNDYRRFYTVLWWASYKYGWDVWYGWHPGTDIAVARWTPVYAMSYWKVTNARKMLWWGNTVTIEHFIEWQKIFSNYSHLDKILVKKWDRVKMWKQIWTVGSTGNSTGNHLHFQIDLETPFNPFFYDRKTCPFSFNTITEEWVCFDELARNTVDPLKFFETNWTILRSLDPPKQIKIPRNITKSSNSNKSSLTIKDRTSIWNRTVHIGYSKSDIKEVQQILKDMNLYSWRITWDYRDIENIIFAFQIDSGILTSRSDIWAGWFWPRTRAALKKSFDKKWLKNKKIKNRDTTSRSSNIKIQKIERKNLKTRKQLKQEEINRFLRNHEFQFNLNSAWENIIVWKTSTINLKILRKNDRRQRFFKWTTPYNITIVTDKDIIRPFPRQFFSMAWWERNITLNWLKPWISNVTILLGNQIIKQYKIRVYDANEKIYLESGMIYWQSNIVAWERQQWIAIFSDKTKKRLIWVRYSWTYKIKWIWDTKICVKTGSPRHILRIHQRKCRPEEFKSEIRFDFNQTVAWVLLFDYKSFWWDWKVKIINIHNNNVLATRALNVFANKSWIISYVR